jgi:hypothetical protein
MEGIWGLASASGKPPCRGLRSCERHPAIAIRRWMAHRRCHQAAVRCPAHRLAFNVSSPSSPSAPISLKRPGTPPPYEVSSVSRWGYHRFSFCPHPRKPPRRGSWSRYHATRIRRRTPRRRCHQPVPSSDTQCSGLLLVFPPLLRCCNPPPFIFLLTTRPGTARYDPHAH